MIRLERGDRGGERTCQAELEINGQREQAGCWVGEGREPNIHAERKPSKTGCKIYSQQSLQVADMSKKKEKRKRKKKKEKRKKKKEKRKKKKEKRKKKKY